MLWMLPKVWRGVRSIFSFIKKTDEPTADRLE